MTPKLVALSIAVVVVLGTAGFLVGRYAVGGDNSEADQPVVRDQLNEIATLEAIKDTEERFVGELVGIHIAPSVDDIPRDVWEKDNDLTAHGCGPAPLDRAESLDLPRALVLPKGFTLSEEDSAAAGVNPWALECDGTVRSRGWDYETAGVEGVPGKATVVRIIVRYDAQDVAKSQVVVEDIGAREAVVIRPASSTGLAQRYLFYFPESFGMTAVQTFNLDEKAAFEIAKAAAEASQ